MHATLFDALAEPTRRRLVEILHAGEHSVNDLVAEVKTAQPGVSRHLRILHEAGLVTARRDGQRRLYSLRPEPLRELEAWARRYAHAERERLQRLAEFIEPKKAARPSKQAPPK